MEWLMSLAVEGMEPLRHVIQGDLTAVGNSWDGCTEALRAHRRIRLSHCNHRIRHKRAHLGSGQCSEGLEYHLDSSVHAEGEVDEAVELSLHHSDAQEAVEAYHLHLPPWAA